MSVQSCELMVAGSGVTVDDQFRRKYTHKWRVTMTDKTDNVIDVLLGITSASPNPVPDIWYSYNIAGNTDTDVYFRGVSVARASDREDDKLHWIVTGNWAPPDDGDHGADPPVINPLSRPTRYALDWINYTKLVDYDNGKETAGSRDGSTPYPITNSSGDKFDPPIEIDDARPVLVATRNMYPLSDIVAFCLYYKNAVNTDTFYDAPARQAKVESITSSQLQEQNGHPYYTVTIRVQFNDLTWDKKLVDNGTQCYENATTKHKIHVRVLDGPKKGEFLDIAHLNADGTQRDSSLPALFKSPAFRIYPEKAFKTGGPFSNGLGIGG